MYTTILNPQDLNSTHSYRFQVKPLTYTLYALLVLSLSACGPSRESLKQLETQISSERAQIRGLKSAQASAAAYHQHLNTGEGEAVIIGIDTVQAAIKAMLPYTYKGSELDKKYLAGEISFTHVEGLAFSAGNTARFWLHFDGSKIKTKKVPAIAKGTVTSLKKAVKAGRMLIETSGYVDQEKKELVLKSNPIQVQFKRENSSSNQSRFLDAARRKIFRKSKHIPLPNGLKGKIQAITTPNHLVLIKK